LSRIKGDSEKNNDINFTLPKCRLRANGSCLKPLHLCNANISGRVAWV
jgi:hypothetical protein